MSEHGDGDGEASSSAAFRSSFAAGRGLPGRITLSPPPPGRLTTLRSRDLTLGGYKKKTFVPNVHSVRKTKDELQETRTAPKKERRERREREDRQRERRRREKPQTIQSHSIFEQGPADTFRKPGNWCSSNLADCDPALVTKCIKKEKNSTEEDDNEILKKLQRDDFLDDPGLKNDPKQRPIRLPLHQSCTFLSTETASSFKETASDNALKSPRAEQKYPLPLRGISAFPQQPTVGELFQQLSVSDQEELLFIQLPDTIPGQPKTASPEKTKKNDKTEDKRSSQNKTMDKPDKAAVPLLSDFSEGLIGKLQIRKSGKVQLVMGNVTLDVSDGAAFSFLQQLVCVRLSEGLTGDMTVLGNITHKLVCSPDFETLLQEAKLPSDLCSASKS
ncbi:DNA-directed RNA polymerase III subunit RPC4 [Pseudorasbora parva]|uniref:DNA-directed RNA polymerase III subunit RPC4 n=1 Tax=Pseudorasbora parva TaxID=51549 RepID=UPI00351DB5C3